MDQGHQSQKGKNQQGFNTRAHFKHRDKKSEWVFLLKPWKCLISNSTSANTIMCAIWDNAFIKALNLGGGGMEGKEA